VFNVQRVVLAIMSSLEFERAIFTDLLAADGLVIVARGLGTEHLLFDLLRLHSTPKRLVFVLNLPVENHQAINERLQAAKIRVPFRRITNEISQDERCGAMRFCIRRVLVTKRIRARCASCARRRRMYLDGGCIAVTSRILVVDLLSKVIATDLISGILVNNAHKFVLMLPLNRASV
jgi:DNA excision repair protein ERCC-4